MYSRLILQFIILFLLTSCSMFNKDKAAESSQERFDRAKSYLSEEKFEKAKNEFQLIIENEKGTSLSLESYFYIGESFFNLENYDEAIYHLNYYSMFSDNIKNVEKAQFVKSKCKFHSTLDYNNDQTQTFLAISTIQEFLDNFPYSIHKDEANQMIAELREKIAKKHFESGRLYLKMKKFDAAMYYFDIVISDYYYTKYSDESKISYIFTYILMEDYKKAEEYLNLNKHTFKSDDQLKIAENILNEYKDGLGLSGYYRLYK